MIFSNSRRTVVPIVLVNIAKEYFRYKSFRTMFPYLIPSNNNISVSV